MNEKAGQRTIIHTAMIPESAGEAPEKRRRAARIKPVRAGGAKRPRRRPAPRRLTFGERLLRNTAVACALLLGILAVKNVDAPWSRAAVDGLESALTMRIDPDSSLGGLEFMKNIMPEASLVFFNISGSSPAQVVSGDVEHVYTAAQPWTTYSCEDDAEVRSAMAGTVSAVTELASGDWCVLVDHGEGLETMYAYMEQPEVASGDSVQRGGRLGVVRGDTLYYEMRRDGSSVEPDGGGAR